MSRINTEQTGAVQQQVARLVAVYDGYLEDWWSRTVGRDDAYEDDELKQRVVSLTDQVATAVEQTRALAQLVRSQSDSMVLMSEQQRSLQRDSSPVVLPPAVIAMIKAIEDRLAEAESKLQQAQTSAHSPPQSPTSKTPSRSPAISPQSSTSSMKRYSSTALIPKTPPSELELDNTLAAIMADVGYGGAAVFTRMGHGKYAFGKSGKILLLRLQNNVTAT